jgi:hypothetical protein
VYSENGKVGIGSRTRWSLTLLMFSSCVCVCVWLGTLILRANFWNEIQAHLTQPEQSEMEQLLFSCYSVVLGVLNIE